MNKIVKNLALRFDLVAKGGRKFVVREIETGNEVSGELELTKAISLVRGLENADRAGSSWIGQGDEGMSELTRVLLETPKMKTRKIRGFEICVDAVNESEIAVISTWSDSALNSLKVRTVREGGKIYKMAPGLIATVKATLSASAQARRAYDAPGAAALGRQAREEIMIDLGVDAPTASNIMAKMRNM